MPPAVRGYDIGVQCTVIMVVQPTYPPNMILPHNNGANAASRRVASIIMHRMYTATQQHRPPRYMPQTQIPRTTKHRQRAEAAAAELRFTACVGGDKSCRVANDQATCTLHPVPYCCPVLLCVPLGGKQGPTMDSAMRRAGKERERLVADLHQLQREIEVCDT